MQRIDVDTPLLTIPLSTERTPSRFVRLTCSGILIISCTIFGFTQCYAQDVAEAARQEKARKENQQKKPKHVYTDEDLKRAQILTPEDRAEVEAKKIRQPVPRGEAAPEPVDAQALPADLPLGDVARRYRRLRETLRLERSAEFHLPFADEPVFATPKPLETNAPEAPKPVTPKHPVVAARPVIVIPAEPRIEPFRPPVKRSPFERPRIYSPVPPRSAANRAAVPKAPEIGEMPSQPPTTLAVPSKPTAPAPDLSVMPLPRLTPHAMSGRSAAPIVRNSLSTAPALSATPAKPVAPAPDLSVMPSPRLKPHATAARPAAPIVRNAPSSASVRSATPSTPAVPKLDFSIMPSPRLTPHTIPTQPAAPIVRATPSRASGFLATLLSPPAPAPDFSVMPSPKVAAHATPAQPAAPVVSATPVLPSPLGVAPSEPAAPVVEAKPSRPPMVAVTPAEPAAVIVPAAPGNLNVVLVKPGDSLWKLAEENLGKGLRWHDILAVNPAIVDANHIEAGSQIFLPSIASSFRTATRIIVRKGDTLSQIAQTRFGHASWWSCIVQANPAIRDANLIYEGQVLLLPASCKP
jgi:nucleoid-associated protein YgaU